MQRNLPSFLQLCGLNAARTHRARAAAARLRKILNGLCGRRAD